MPAGYFPGSYFAGGVFPVGYFPGTQVEPSDVPISYDIIWAGTVPVIFSLGANGPLRVAVSRPDGGAVVAPSVMSFAALDFSGVALATQPGATILEGDGSPQSTQYFSARYPMAVGAFYAVFDATIGLDTISYTVMVICNQ